jgi:ABC-type Fe3+/spermidine/putrescine transport system ATPase subunit
MIDGKVTDGRFVADGFALETAGVPSGQAAISIRPQDITIGPAGTGIQATVAHREFLGSVTRYKIRIGNNTVTVDVPHRRDVVPYNVGATVGAVIDPKQAALLR